MKLSHTLVLSHQGENLNFFSHLDRKSVSIKYHEEKEDDIKYLIYLMDIGIYKYIYV